MLAWFAENLATILVGFVVFALLFAVAAGMIRSRKKGKSSCSCGGCAGCAAKGSCHSAR